MSWFKKKATSVVPLVQLNSVYAVLNAELERLHKQIHTGVENNNADNATIFNNRVNKIQDALLEALKAQPSHEEAIIDLQNAVADIILTGNGAT